MWPAVVLPGCIALAFAGVGFGGIVAFLVLGSLVAWGTYGWISSQLRPTATPQAVQLEQTNRALVEEIATRRRVLQRMQEVEAETRAMIEGAVDAILTIDEQGAVLSANPAAERLFDYRTSELIGRSVSELMPEPHASDHDSYVRSYLQTGEAKIIGIGRTVEAMRRDGTLVPVRLAVSEIRRAGGRVFMGTLHDLTQERLLERQLTQATKLAAMGELAGHIAHEVNNPIGVVSAKVRLLLSGDEALSEKVRSDLNKIVQQCDRVSTLTRGLLDYCRPTDAPKVALDMLGPLQRAMGFLETQAARGGVRVIKELEPAPVSRANGGELEQVFLNLILNALQAMPNGGALTLRSGRADRARGPGSQVEVRDTGGGMDEATRLRVFEPFFTTKGVKGNGLGLAICYGLVHAHDGELEVESEPGQGSAFRVWLPVTPT
ncbi:MAG: PAS domain S-box protein [Planctomycetes bacterium]|nr:PAS domain S-box protein [Planctomycetota bacterium]